MTILILFPRPYWLPALPLTLGQIEPEHHKSWCLPEVNVKRQQTKNAASAYFFTRSGEVIYFVFLCFYSLYIVKYIMLGPTIFFLL